MSLMDAERLTLLEGALMSEQVRKKDYKKDGHRVYYAEQDGTGRYVLGHFYLGVVPAVSFPVEGDLEGRI